VVEAGHYQKVEQPRPRRSAVSTLFPCLPNQLLKPLEIPSRIGCALYNSDNNDALLETSHQSASWIEKLVIDGCADSIPCPEIRICLGHTVGATCLGDV
jgi:hypothetical protein